MEMQRNSMNDFILANKVRRTAWLATRTHAVCDPNRKGGSGVSFGRNYCELNMLETYFHGSASGCAGKRK
jgi:hypothetical protein